MTEIEKASLRTIFNATIYQQKFNNILWCFQFNKHILQDASSLRKSYLNIL